MLFDKRKSLFIDGVLLWFIRRDARVWHARCAPAGSESQTAARVVVSFSIKRAARRIAAAVVAPLILDVAAVVPVGVADTHTHTHAQAQTSTQIACPCSVYNDNNYNKV